MADHPVVDLLAAVRSRLAGEAVEGPSTVSPGISSATVADHADTSRGVVAGDPDDPTEDPTPRRINKKRPGNKSPARWVIPLTQREEHMLQRLVDNFDYSRAVLGRMLLRDAYRELFSEKPPTVGVEGEG